MKVILMNKNTEILSALYDPATGVFVKIIDVYNIKYAPLKKKKILFIKIVV